MHSIESRFVTGLIKMHSIESRFVTGPSDMLFAGMYVCTFQPGNFTGWGYEGVNYKTALALIAPRRKVSNF